MTHVIFTEQVRSVLKCFKPISPNLQIKVGNIISTITPGKTVLAEAVLDHSFDTGMSFADLGQFLVMTSTFTDPEVVVDQEYITLNEGRRKLKYGLADPDHITVPPNKKVTMPSVDATFKFTAEFFKDMMKMVGSLGFSELAFVGDGNQINVTSFSTTDPKASSFTISELGPTDQTFLAVFKTENIGLLPMADYDVEFCKRGLSKFVTKISDTAYITYFVAIEAAASKFD